MRIEVTQEDIDKGVKENCVKCPVALSLRRLFPGEWEVDVGDDAIYAGGNWYTPPDEAQEFIAKFDAGEPVAPFSFDVDLPEPT